MFKIDRNLVKLSTPPATRSGAAGVMPREISAEESSRAEALTKAYQDAEAEGRAAAEEIISEAREEARRIVREAEAEAQELRERTRDEGYAYGKAEGARETELERAADRESIGRILSELEQERERIIGDMESEIIDLTFTMVKKIVNLAEETDDKIFESMIIKALRKVKLEGWVTIRVSSAEYEKYFSSGSAAFVLGEETVTASVIPDSSLGSWDCVIDTNDGTINASLDSQLKQIRIAFNGASVL